MSDVEEEKLYGLMEIAERQQIVAQTALEGMASVLSSFGEERVRWMSSVGSLSEDVRGAVHTAASESMVGVAETSAEAVKEVAQALVDRMAGVSVQAEQAEASLRGIVHWASWRLLRWCLVAAVGLTLVWWGALSAVLWWDTSAIGSAQVRKVRLQEEIAELQATRDAWASAGLLAKLEQCGPKKRPCVQVDESAGSFGDRSDYRILRGY
jgi:hypothetical protein